MAPPRGILGLDHLAFPGWETLKIPIEGVSIDTQWKFQVSSLVYLAQTFYKHGAQSIHEVKQVYNKLPVLFAYNNLCTST